jgi:DNA-binding IclR family transcriptional regulator
MPKAIIDKEIALARQRLSMCEIAFMMVADARDDFMPEMSVPEFAETISIIKMVAEEHLLGVMPTASKLSRLTDIPRQTLHRKLSALVERGALVRRGNRFALCPQFYNHSHQIAGFYRRLRTIRAISDAILETVNWKKLTQSPCVRKQERTQTEV